MFFSKYILEPFLKSMVITKYSLVLISVVRWNGNIDSKEKENNVKLDS